MSALWSDCLSHLKTKISSIEYNTWLRPLQATQAPDLLTLYAQNQFVAIQVREKFFDEIVSLARFLAKNEQLQVNIQIGLKPADAQAKPASQTVETEEPNPLQRTGINPKQTFENFVQGHSNQIAKSIAEEVAQNPGAEHCNPFSIYGGTGLGKTHLLNAIGNEILRRNPNAKIRCVTGERFMNERGKAIHNNTIENFKKYYRSLDILMIDDIQFLARHTGKNASSEEFLNTFNTLLENHKQIILVSDVYPENIENLEERIKSRISWGVNAAIEPPELETRVAILRQKAKGMHNVELPEETAYFIAQKLRSNVRVLEGAVHNLVAWCKFKGIPPSVDAARERLKDTFNSYDQLITIENIQRLVAEHYNIKLADIKSKSRTRTVARPRQMAMALAKALTNHSLPEIGREFGGRDHTTVMHACKTINELRESDASLQEDYVALTRKLSS